MRALFVFSLVLCACGFSAAQTGDGEPTSQVTGAQAAASAHPHATLAFNPDWTSTQTGALVRGGHVDVSHAASRMGQCAPATVFSYARFVPGGQLASSDQAFGFDIPFDATSVQLWFHAVAPGCDAWDSNFGRNWSFPVIASAPPDIGWAGDWGSSTDRACMHGAGVAEPITIDEYMRERACIFVDLDVWVPGVSDVASPRPEYIAATVSWSKDGAAPTVEPLQYQGIQWHNARFRWSVPDVIRNRDDWYTVKYSFPVVSDGVNGHRYALPSGADRTLVRNFTFTP